MLTVDEDRTPVTPRPRRRVTAALALAALPFLVAGCGAASSDTVTPQAPASSTGAGVNTNLTIVVVDNGKTDNWTLSCDPAGGTHPNPTAACAALTAKGRTAIPPVAKDVMCTQIYGGPQTAKITGTWQGQPVNATFSRHNGCEITRWKALTGLLPATGGAGAQ
jgi:hypothetical protein